MTSLDLRDLEINKTKIYFQQDNDPKHTFETGTRMVPEKEGRYMDWPQIVRYEHH